MHSPGRHSESVQGRFIFSPLQSFMEHFMARKGSSNFISPLQQAVSQPLLERGNVDLEIVLHWKGGGTAAGCGPRAGGTTTSWPPPCRMLGLRMCPQIILILKIILQTNLFGSREAWMKRELSCRALWIWASPSMLGMAVLAQLCSANRVEWVQVGSVMTRPIYKWLPGRALDTLFKPNPFMDILGKCGMS